MPQVGSHESRGPMKPRAAALNVSGLQRAGKRVPNDERGDDRTEDDTDADRDPDVGPGARAGATRGSAAARRAAGAAHRARDEALRGGAEEEAGLGRQRRVDVDPTRRDLRDPR